MLFDSYFSISFSLASPSIDLPLFSLDSQAIFCMLLSSPLSSCCIPDWFFEDPVIQVLLSKNV